MSTYGTDVCTICGGAISANELVSGPCWHHRDLSICQKAIRDAVEIDLREWLAAGVASLYPDNHIPDHCFEGLIEYIRTGMAFG